MSLRNRVQQMARKMQTLQREIAAATGSRRQELRQELSRLVDEHRLAKTAMLAERQKSEQLSEHTLTAVRETLRLADHAVGMLSRDVDRLRYWNRIATHATRLRYEISARMKREQRERSEQQVAATNFAPGEK